MIRRLAIAVLIASCGGAFAQTFDAFEVATIKSTAPDWQGGRYITLQGRQFVAKNFALKILLAAAYNLTPKAISGGPGWVDSDRYDILAKTPGEIRPTHDEQMSMLRKLVSDRFKLDFHRETKEFSIYALTVAKNGAKLRDGTESPDPKPLVFVLSPQEVRLPGRNVTMGELASVMQRSALDRPVLDYSGLRGRYDFDLEFTPDETQFSGAGLRGTPESTKPDLFSAIQQQLGLRLEATRGPIETVVIDRVERPTAN